MAVLRTITIQLDHITGMVLLLRLQPIWATIYFIPVYVMFNVTFENCAFVTTLL